MMSGYAINEKRIKAIEDKIDNLSTELRSEFKKEIQEVNKNLLELAKKPVNIYNQISLASNKLEEKVDEILNNN